MAATVLPVLLVVLLGLTSETISTEITAAEGGPIEDDVNTLLDRNSLAVSRLNHLFQNLMEFMTQNPCLETEVAEKVAEIMTEGFNSTKEAMKEVQMTIRRMRLVNWRIDFIRSMGVHQIDSFRPCPLPFFMLDGECIHIEKKVARTFRDAKLACAVMGGYIAEPADTTGFARQVDKMGIGSYASVYIGATRKQDGSWNWQTSDDTSETLKDIPWKSGKPDDKNCLVTKERVYEDVHCNSKRMYACERSILVL